ncbi:hypothetical protein GA0070624_0712 [Micromonospora rhizosphaerae]|uniref:GH26 domain-containing protein n=1 Tax=Micromonospora rhizosphaerae TaxID=568872 RepID=A0A1C6RE11_9ACTN|nr:hypothetical protein [Micromonospora rhizosphaerae]SCL15407.1 hypothetical protein GA0070624_0712 [Micromonospora rhizosphaerae]
MGPGPSIAPVLDPRPAPAPPSGPGPARRRRRRWLLAVALVLVLLGATAAVVIIGNESPAGNAAPEVAGPGTPAQAPGPATSDAIGGPDGVAGFGTNPSLGTTRSPSAAPDADFRPFPAPRTTLPGASIHLLSGESFADGLARSDRTYGPLRMVRVFYPGLPPAWSGSRADVVNRTVVVSFKAPPAEVAAGKHDDRLAKWFASIPRDQDVYWSYFHEPENDVESGNYTTAQFRAAWRRVAGLADRARNPQLRATLILMCWTLNPNSRRNFNDYYPGADVVDVLGWDCYNSGGKYNRYTDPAQVFGPMITKSKALGKPWGLAETGSVRIDGDSSGTGRAAWLRSMSSYLNSQRPLWVAYYDYQVSGGDFRLTDKPSQDAWRAWCAAPR